MDRQTDIVQHAVVQKVQLLHKLARFWGQVPAGVVGVLPSCSPIEAVRYGRPKMRAESIQGLRPRLLAHDQVDSKGPVRMDEETVLRNEVYPYFPPCHPVPYQKLRVFIDGHVANVLFAPSPIPQRRYGGCQIGERRDETRARMTNVRRDLVVRCGGGVSVPPPHDFRRQPPYVVMSRDESFDSPEQIRAYHGGSSRLRNVYVQSLGRVRRGGGGGGACDCRREAPLL
mmetsp:Transcript_16590/g.47764  ORF Transcript_16590/g.47764 Transcript_16590/m.47764 type:complete len:228 (+) Transcript_16590:424-1107(+)